MSKLNPISSERGTAPKLAGGAGNLAARQDTISDLRRLVLANLLWEDNFYIDGKFIANEIKLLVPLCTPSQVAELAIEARKKQKLRHIPLFLCVCMLKHKEHAKLVSEILPVVITRPDMLTDFIAIYAKENDGKIKPLAKHAKLGLAKAFDNFDEYQFAKYDRDAPVKIRDVMFLVHPKPSKEKADLYKRIADRNLKTPDTWEVALSTGADKLETWSRLISTGKIGGLAFLRNLRNMTTAGVTKQSMAHGFSSLKNSMLLPINFLKAMRTNTTLTTEIETSMIEAYKNLPVLKGRTLFIVDVSGSMGDFGFGENIQSRMDRASALAMLAVNQCEQSVVVCTAGNDSKGIGAHAIIDSPSRGFDLFNQISTLKSRLGGGGIFTRQCIDWCKDTIPGDFERIIVFSDSQDCDNNHRLPTPYGKFNYICDVSSERRGINHRGVWTAEITGFSENFLTYIAAYEGVQNVFDME